MRTPLHPRAAGDAGFTLIEVMVTTLILLAVSGVVFTGVQNMTQLNATTTNRTTMFAGVRNATALLEQEVGQAGRISLPGTVLITAAAAKNNTALTVSDTTGMFRGEYLVVGTGDSGESVTIASIDSLTGLTVSALENDHAANEPVRVEGAFWAGVVPPILFDNTANPDGSSGSVLKIFGDINGSGKMVYVEYTCNLDDGVLYRNQMDFDKVGKSKPGVEQILVEHVKANPDGTDCFKYQTEIIDTKVFVIGVAITLTVESENADPVTGEKQKESKALLNVSPRNVFNAWQLYSQLLENRVQTTPATTAALMPGTGN